MASPNWEAVETFMSITGVSETVAAQKLQEHQGNLNEAVNAHFNEADGNSAHGIPVPGHEDDLMDIDEPVESLPEEPPAELPTTARSTNSFSVLDSNYSTGLSGHTSDLLARIPFGNHPREVEVRQSNEPSQHSGHASTTEHVNETADAHELDMHEAVTIDYRDGRSLTRENRSWIEESRDPLGDSSSNRHFVPSAPAFDTLPNDSNDIEEEMVRAAIEASKQSAEEGRHAIPGQRPPHLDDANFGQAVSVSLKTAEEEKLLREKASKIGASEAGASKVPDVEQQQIESSNGRPESGSTFYQDKTEDKEEQPLIRDSSRHVPPGSTERPQSDGGVDITQPISSEAPNEEIQPSLGNAFVSDEWGGMSLEERDEAVMLEAAMFGGIPESRYQSEYDPQFIQPESSYAPWIHHSPSPLLEAQRSIREQQDEEYHASLQADREKEMKAMREAEVRLLEEEAAMKAARIKMDEEQELERQLAAKEASLPPEPAADDENAITLLVRMPDGGRRGRRFLKSDKLQILFDFVDTGRSVKPGTYRLVRPYPRRAFGNRESSLTLNELGLTSKQEALFLEMI